MSLFAFNFQLFCTCIIITLHAYNQRTNLSKMPWFFTVNMKSLAITSQRMLSLFSKEINKGLWSTPHQQFYCTKAKMQYTTKTISKLSPSGLNAVNEIVVEKKEHLCMLAVSSQFGWCRWSFSLVCVRFTCLACIALCWPSCFIWLCVHPHPPLPYYCFHWFVSVMGTWFPWRGGS